MFSIKNKLDRNLRYSLLNNEHKYYRVLIKYKSLSESLKKKIISYKGTLIYILKISNIICAKLDKKSIERIIEYPEVKFITFDEYLFLCGMSVSTANKAYFYKKLNFSGKDINIGLVDSGVYPHPDLSTPSNKINSFVDVINNLSYPYDDNGHGTAIAGIIAGNGASSENMYRGIAPYSILHCYKAFNSLGKGFSSDVLFSIESLLLNYDENNIKILCLPFELLTHNMLILEAFNNIFSIAVNKNITPIVPSGSNENIEGSICGIGNLKNCITVGGIDTSSIEKPFKYSSAGTLKSGKPDLCAACVNITSLNSNTSYISEKDGHKLYPPKLSSSYKSFSGTSLAVAYVTGIVALLYESNPSLTFKDIFSLLKLSCETLDFPKFNQGEGVINLTKLPF